MWKKLQNVSNLSSFFPHCHVENLICVHFDLVDAVFMAFDHHNDVVLEILSVRFVNIIAGGWQSIKRWIGCVEIQVESIFFSIKLWKIGHNVD